MKNKMFNYDFLVVGAGLIGALTALRLSQSKYKVLIVDKKNQSLKDNRTLAVNANSKDFLEQLGLWRKLKSCPEPINKIEISDSNNTAPLIFENDEEPMGNVILNHELLTSATDALMKKKILFNNIDISLTDILENKFIQIKNNKYIFKHSILCLGKNFSNKKIINKYTFVGNHKSYVGFFKHSYNHSQTAYEIFTPNGPLAILPAPSKSKKVSTFIYSSNQKTSYENIKTLIKKNFNASHGELVFDKESYQFEILPHLSKPKSHKFFLVGDVLRSIHPVAGQGWNLGIKDVQQLMKLLNSNELDDPNLLRKYYNNRSIESFSYLSFTNLLNALYENQNPVTSFLTKFGFKSMKSSQYLRSIFIKQAMGRLNLI
jgi:ubiquinone biosynthesis UbiH/UbiF/VisC/COQ6 family hydroxylase